MRYCGSKKRYAKYIIPYLIGAIKNENTTFIDMCCGGCSIVSEMPHKKKIAVDNNEYLISLWNKLKQNVLNGFPCDGIPFDITEEQYYSIKECWLNKDGRWPNYMIGYVANALSYGSSWFNGFAKPNYNKSNKYGQPENHCHEAYNSLKKQLLNFKFIENTNFICSSFENFEIPSDSVLYIDPPYIGTKKYKDDFPHEQFYEWCRKISKKNVKIFMSEYDAPDDFECIWQMEKKDGLGTQKGKKQNIKVEKLFVYNGK